ncbi:hypothetical protein JCM10449v2_005027 [Rhodotorula kratochvilovae]
MDQQELVDRLIVAVEEQDVLYVVLHLQDMVRRGLIDLASKKSDGINLERSWKKRSALVAADQPFSPLSEFILVLLLLHVREPHAQQIRSVAHHVGTGWVEGLVQFWEVARADQRRDAEQLLQLEPSDVAEWIDTHGLSHPDPDSLTGNGPLPPAPPSPAPSPRQATPPASLASNQTFPPTGPSPGPSADEPDDLAARQVRLCDLQPGLTAVQIHQRFPDLTGLVDAGLIYKNACLLTFTSKEVAVMAMSQLQGRPEYRAAILESAYLQSTRLGPHPSVALAPGAASPSSSSTLSKLPAGWKPPGADSLENPFRVFVHNLPVDVRSHDIQSLLDWVGVPFSALKFSHSRDFTTAHFNVPSREAFHQLRASLNKSSLRGHVMSIARALPPVSADHPLVVVRNISAKYSASGLRTLTRMVGCGGYAEQVLDLGGGEGEGWFRVSSPDNAQECVDALQGYVAAERPLEARWVKADGTAPEGGGLPRVQRAASAGAAAGPALDHETAQSEPAPPAAFGTAPLGGSRPTLAIVTSVDPSATLAMPPPVVATDIPARSNSAASSSPTPAFESPLATRSSRTPIPPPSPEPQRMSAPAARSPSRGAPTSAPLVPGSAPASTLAAPRAGTKEDAPVDPWAEMLRERREKRRSEGGEEDPAGAERGTAAKRARRWRL